ncbi:MAG: 3-hydroxyacyl-ACP dehydratase FabZ family protein [Nitrospinaceae bacterium]
MDEICKLIPHRPPFLFVDEIVEYSGDVIRTRRRVSPDEPFFQGHYPDFPIMPGALLCEAVFQSGALLMAKRGQEAAAQQTGRQPTGGRVPVLTRVKDVKLKHAVYPGDVLEMTARFSGQAGPACYLTGRAETNGKTALTVEFTVMLMEPQP